MADEAKIGKPWDDDELDAIVADYFAMLTKELAGEPYVKAHHAKVLMAQTGRTHRSVEFKHMNLSAALMELGLPTIPGYRPKPNYQAAIFPAIERYLMAHPEWQDGVPVLTPTSRRERLPDPVGWDETAGVSAGAPSLPLRMDPEAPPPAPPPGPRPPGLERLVRKFDPVLRDFRNRALGRAGEELVVRFEHARLSRLDRPDLARKVRWVSQEDGDGAGYDVHSFDANGNDRLIEVKSTHGPRTTPFFLTRNEASLAQERPDAYRIYRLYDLARTPSAFKLRPPLEKAVRLEVETWRAWVG